MSSPPWLNDMVEISPENSMEENNNDPNNNLDDVEVSRPGSSRSNDLVEPQPGCSKDFINDSNMGDHPPSKNLVQYDDTMDTESSVDSIIVQMRPKHYSKEDSDSMSSDYPDQHNSLRASDDSNGSNFDKESRSSGRESCDEEEENRDDSADCRSESNRSEDNSEYGDPRYYSSPETISDESEEGDTGNKNSFPIKSVDHKNSASVVSELPKEENKRHNENVEIQEQVIEIDGTSDAFPHVPGEQPIDEALEKDVQCAQHLLPYLDKDIVRECFLKHKNNPNKSIVVLQELLSLKKPTAEEETLKKRKMEDICPIAIKKSVRNESTSNDQPGASKVVNSMENPSTSTVPKKDVSGSPEETSQTNAGAVAGAAENQSSSVVVRRKIAAQHELVSANYVPELMETNDSEQAQSKEKPTVPFTGPTASSSTSSRKVLSPAKFVPPNSSAINSLKVRSVASINGLTQPQETKDTSKKALPVIIDSTEQQKKKNIVWASKFQAEAAHMKAMLTTHATPAYKTPQASFNYHKLGEEVENQEKAAKTAAENQGKIGITNAGPVTLHVPTSYSNIVQGVSNSRGPIRHETQPVTTVRTTNLSSGRPTATISNIHRPPVPTLTIVNPQQVYRISELASYALPKPGVLRPNQLTAKNLERTIQPTDANQLLRLTKETINAAPSTSNSTSRPLSPVINRNRNNYYGPGPSTSKAVASEIVTIPNLSSKKQEAAPSNIVTIPDSPPAEISGEEMMSIFGNLEDEIRKLPDTSVYYDLVNMFSNVNREYVAALCKKFSSKYNREMLIHNLIDHLLSHGHKFPRTANESALEPSKPEDIDLEEQYDNLLGIFPDADPNYLRQKAEELYKDREAFANFVQSNMENRMYPTKEQYLKQLKLKKQIEQYTTNFDIKQFLEIFPDPEKYFKDPKKTTNEHQAFEYLKFKFNKIRLDTITKTFRKYKNLSLAIAELERIKMDMKSKRNIWEPLPSDNIPFLQEVAYVKHQKEIEDYLKEMKHREKKEFDELKNKGQLLECQCCYNDECLPSKCYSCDNGHVFCNSCIINGTESKLSDGDSHVKCFMDCGVEFPISILQKVLKPTKFSILLRKRQEAEIMAAGLEGLVSCPYCHFSSIPPPEDKVFKCLNPDCMKESCRACKEPNHVPYKCEEVKSDNARHYLEERMTEALLRTCYKCKKQFYKEDGCNKMTCTCGATMCYLCNAPIKDYGHFRGQGSEATDLCPLYTDDKRLNAEVVRRVAQQTAKEMLQKNPNLKLDTEKLMPDLPKPQKGPHTTIVHANQLPEHARRARPYTDN